MKINTYMTIKVNAYEAETPEGYLMKNTNLIFIEDNPKKAIERAKKLIKASHYRVSDIIEYNAEQ